MRRLYITPVVLFLAYFVVLFVAGDRWLEWRMSALGRGVALLIVVLGQLGIGYFIVDAICRQYHADRSLALALALLGVFSFGLTTVIYFLVWGWQARYVAYASEFCDTCIGESSELTTPLDLTVVNFIHGGRLVGSAKKCGTCGSTVKTHCFYVLGIPVSSRGSFRAQCPAMGRYILRQTLFFWPHLLQIIMMPAVLLACLLAILSMVD